LVFPQCRIERDFDSYDALTYLKGCGVEWYSDQTLLKSTLRELVDDAVEIFGDLRRGIQGDRWNAIREKLFTKPYIEFLRSQGIADFPLRDTSHFSIIEYLLAKDIPVTEIAIQIGICEANDPSQEKKRSASFINNYIRSKYKNAFENYNIENVRNYLKSRFIGDDLYW